jgi:ubiquitin carboxyl-terminal hydrolase 22/27/51
MSIHHLPQVLCLHLKRFDHTGFAAARSGSKIEQYVSFPLVGLDLGPYRHDKLISPLSPKPMSAAMKQSPTWAVAHGSQSNGAGASARAAGSSSSSSSASSLYDLFCVIVHKGSLDTGHYICYVRRGFDWFRLDDRHVVRVEHEEVKLASAYLLFYVKTDR